MGDNDNLPFERWTVERVEARIKFLEAGLKNENIAPETKKNVEHTLAILSDLKHRMETK